MDGIEDKRVFICDSFDSRTSAAGIATCSVSLRVMLSGDAVMPGKQKRKYE